MTTTEFNQMYSDNKNEIMSYLNWKLNNIHNAEDLTAQVFAKAYRLITTDKSEHRFDPSKSDVKTWLRTIANTALIDYYRTDHSDKYQAVSDFVNSEGDETFQFISDCGADTNMLNNELKTRLSSAFSSLKPKYRVMAKLYFKNELSYAEIAELCNVPMGTVKGMLNRCRGMLQNQLTGVRVG
jgi:RNA polymerase sigma-70 factor, ECF subfamily